jgi:hypothetical protein
MIQNAEEFVRLRQSTDPQDYRRAAHEEASEVVWQDVIDRFPDMRKWVAQNKSVPLSILTKLASDDDADVRGWVAQRRKLSFALFYQLARDADAKVRHIICHNAQTPEETLARLAEDSDPFVKDAARKRLKAS